MSCRVDTVIWQKWKIQVTQQVTNLCANSTSWPWNKFASSSSLTDLLVLGSLSPWLPQAPQVWAYAILGPFYSTSTHHPNSNDHLDALVVCLENRQPLIGPFPPVIESYLLGRHNYPYQPKTNVSYNLNAGRIARTLLLLNDSKQHSFCAEKHQNLTRMGE